jgi:hypothetical protein
MGACLLTPSDARDGQQKCHPAMHAVCGQCPICTGMCTYTHVHCRNGSALHTATSIAQGHEGSCIVGQHTGSWCYRPLQAAGAWTRFAQWQVVSFVAKSRQCGALEPVAAHPADAFDEHALATQRAPGRAKLMCGCYVTADQGL